MKSGEHLLKSDDPATVDTQRSAEQARGPYREEIRAHQRKDMLDSGEPIPIRDDDIIPEHGDPIARHHPPAPQHDESTPRNEVPVSKEPPLHASTGLFEQEEMQRLRSRWADIQGSFVDEPRRTVKEADTLVAEVTRRVTEVFGNERSKLEQQWGRGDNVTTEDLRLALRRYHAFFDRLLSV